MRRGWAEGKGCHGVWQGPVQSSHFGEFAWRAIKSHGRVFRAGSGVSRLSWLLVERGWEGSKADLKLVRRSQPWPGAEVVLVAETQAGLYVT